MPCGQTMRRAILNDALLPLPDLAVEGFDGYIGKDLGTADLCKMLGTWHAKYGAAAAGGK